MKTAAGAATAETLHGPAHRAAAARRLGSGAHKAAARPQPGIAARDIFLADPREGGAGGGCGGGARGPGRGGGEREARQKITEEGIQAIPSPPTPEGKKKKKKTQLKKKKRTPPLRLERFAKDAPRDAVEASNSSEVRVRLASCKRSALGSLKTFFVKKIKIKPKSLLGGGGKAAPQI